MTTQHRFAFPLTAVAAAMLASLQALAQTPAPSQADAPAKSLGIITINSSQPTSLPTQIPTTIEGVTKEQIEQTINATDSQDALKYFPSLLVRKRYIGDYNHAVLSSRASGTGNSARSMVYADGILLSNYLGNGAAYTPRWGLVTPEEIERVDVLYGPFSAAYAGNSVGAVVDYVTRSPMQFEANAKLSIFSQNFKLYGTDSTYGGTQASASLGNKNSDWSWFANVKRTLSASQPLVFATRTMSAASPVAGAQVVSGAAQGLNATNTPIVIRGGATQYKTTQEHARPRQGRAGVSRATGLVSYRFDPQWTASLGARYSGTQFATLNNIDVNGFAYQGASKYFTTDVRVRFQASKQVSMALGIDNLNNYQYWNFHPYPQRTLFAELKFAL